MTPIKPTLAKRAPRGMEMARLGSREMREFIEAEAIDIFTTMTNGGCTFQQSLAAIFLSGMNAAESTRREQWQGLTDEEVRDFWSWSMTQDAEHIANTQQHAFARAIEAKLREKNS